MEIEDFSNDTTVPIATYSDISVTPDTSATFIVSTSTPQNTEIQVDTDGDGAVDVTVSPDAESLGELLIKLQVEVQKLNIKEKLKTQLLNKISTIQKKIDKQKQKQSSVLDSLKTLVQKKSDKGKIDSILAVQISGLLEDLIVQSATVPLDPALINQLKDHLNALTVPQTLKNNLLKKVNRLQNIIAITRSLASFTQTITKKGGKGQIADTDVQNLLNLLNQIQNAL